MELYTIIAALWIISLSFVSISPYTSHQAPMIHSSTNEGVHAAAQLISRPPALPRKLIKFNEEVMVKDSDHKKDIATFHKPKEGFSGKSYVQEAKSTHAKKGTREEWMESDDTSEFFTMDYSRVKRRRPIHNKSVPIAP